MTFRERLDTGITLFDGATGTELMRIARAAEAKLPIVPCERLNLIAPAIVGLVHEGYLAAGADVIETNTICANGAQMKFHQLEHDIFALNVAAATIAREVAQRYSADTPRYVAGSIGPLPPAYRQASRHDEALSLYKQQAIGLLAGGIDLFILETFCDLTLMAVACRAIRDAQITAQADLPIVGCLFPSRRLLDAAEFEWRELAERVDSLDLDLFGFNCGESLSLYEPLLARLRNYYRGDLIIMPSLGQPDVLGDAPMYGITPEQFVATVRRLCSQFPIRAVGGCCGTTPDHIRLLHDAVIAAPAKPTPA